MAVIKIKYINLPEKAYTDTYITFDVEVQKTGGNSNTFAASIDLLSKSWEVHVCNYEVRYLYSVGEKTLYSVGFFMPMDDVEVITDVYYSETGYGGGWILDSSVTEIVKIDNSEDKNVPWGWIGIGAGAIAFIGLIAALGSKK